LQKGTHSTALFHKKKGESTSVSQQENAIYSHVGHELSSSTAAWHSHLTTVKSRQCTVSSSCPQHCEGFPLTSSVKRLEYCSLRSFQSRLIVFSTNYFVRGSFTSSSTFLFFEKTMRFSSKIEFNFEEKI